MLLYILKELVLLAGMLLIMFYTNWAITFIIVCLITFLSISYILFLKIN